MTRTLVLAAMLGALSASCVRSPTPCTTPGVCASDEECLANRCVPLGSDPVTPATRRAVLTPRAIAVVSANRRAAALPSAVTFGSAIEGDATLYLAFEIGSYEIHRLDSAFLLLEPLPMTRLEPAPVEIEAWRVREPWDRARVTWLGQPALAPPHSCGSAPSSSSVPFRIDVSEIIRFWVRQPRQNRGLALKAPGGDGHGVSFATGASGGVAPRLEIYFR